MEPLDEIILRDLLNDKELRRRRPIFKLKNPALYRNRQARGDKPKGSYSREFTLDPTCNVAICDNGIPALILVHDGTNDDITNWALRLSARSKVKIVGFKD